MADILHPIVVLIVKYRRLVLIVYMNHYGIAIRMLWKWTNDVEEQESGKQEKGD